MKYDYQQEKNVCFVNMCYYYVIRNSNSQELWLLGHLKVLQNNTIELPNFPIYERRTRTRLEPLRYDHFIYIKD